MEDEESLKSSTLICQLADAIKHQVNNFLANGIVTTSVVVGGIFLASDQLFRVEKLAVSSGTYFI